MKVRRTGNARHGELLSPLPIGYTREQRTRVVREVFDRIVVSGEQVAEITQGAVRLSLTPEQAAQLEEYQEPPESVRIEPDARDDSLWQRIRSVFRRPTS